jgi:Chlorite dismutase
MLMSTTRSDPPDGSPGDAQLQSTQRAATTPLLVSFAAGNIGAWRIDRITPVAGDSLAGASRLNVIESGNAMNGSTAAWTLRGSTSNTRYTTRSEVEQLASRQEGLNRPAATRAALIPIRKTDAWWTMAQDERRAIFEEQSRHIAIGLRHLPGVARRLHHSRELGEAFDFLTWFEYPPESSDLFEDLVRALRATPEWQFVDREVDIRLSLPSS